MRNILYVLLLMVSSVIVVKAQYTGFKPIADLPGFKKEFAIQSAKVQTILSDFRQEKELAALTEKITSTGKFWFKRSNKVRIDYQKPFVYRLVMNGDKVLLKDEQKESKANVKSNKLFQQINRIMVDCIQGTVLESSDFTTKVFESDKKFLIEMKPASKTIRDFFSVILLTVDRTSYAVDQIEMKESGGDRTVLIFSNKILNQAISDEVFSF
jgi:outer membrane lipoprotein-sorting protein